MDKGLLIIDKLSDNIYCLQLNRPKKMNALSIALRKNLSKQINQLAINPDCSGIILTGAGQAFCSGMDFTQFGGDTDNKLNLFHSTRDMFSALLNFPKPIIGAINGVAAGGGFMLALCCDHIFATPNAFFGFFEVKRGIPAPYHILRLFVGEEAAKTWCDTGQRIDPEEAFREKILKAIVTPEILIETCRKEALNKCPDKRKITQNMKNAFQKEMQIFKTALFPGNIPAHLNDKTEE